MCGVIAHFLLGRAAPPWPLRSPPSSPPSAKPACPVPGPRASSSPARAPSSAGRRRGDTVTARVRAAGPAGRPLGHPLPGRRRVVLRLRVPRRPLRPRRRRGDRAEPASPRPARGRRVDARGSREPRPGCRPDAAENPAAPGRWPACATASSARTARWRCGAWWCGPTARRSCSASRSAEPGRAHARRRRPLAHARGPRRRSHRRRRGSPAGSPPTGSPTSSASCPRRTCASTARRCRPRRGAGAARGGARSRRRRGADHRARPARHRGGGRRHRPLRRHAPRRSARSISPASAWSASPSSGASRRGELGHLVSEVLPGIEKRIPVEIKTRPPAPRRRAPTRPRIQIELSQKQHTLSVTASARLRRSARRPHRRRQAGACSASACPPATRPTERALVARLRDELHLVPGRRVDFDGTDAIRFAQKLQAWKGGGAEAATRELFRAGKLVPAPAHRGRSLRRLVRARGRGRRAGRPAQARRRRRRDARLARRAAARAARRRRLGAAARGLARRATAPASPICSRPARRRQGRDRGAARPGRALRRARAPAPGRLRPAAPARRGLRAHPRGRRCPRISPPSCATTSTRG